jgi:error-prone DNA polymerase
MPEQTNIKEKPVVPAALSAEERQARAGGVDYAELEVTSNFSFLRSGSHPEELVVAAAEAGCRAVALTDWHTAAGLVRGRMAAKDAGVQFVVGCRVVGMVSGGREKEIRGEGNEEIREEEGGLFRGFPVELLLYPTTRGAYGRMCRLLTTGKRRTAKGLCDLLLEEILAAAPEMLAILVPPEPVLAGPQFYTAAGRVREAFDSDRLSLAARCVYDGHDAARLGRLAAMARRLEVPLVATNDVHYHVPERRALQDVLTCVRLGCTVQQAGFALFANAERHIKGPAETARLFRDYPQAITRTVEIARRAATFSLGQLKYEYPDEICPAGKTLMQHLTDRTWEGAAERYGYNIPPTVRQRLEHELKLIEELNYPAYFLTVDDIVRFARSRGILCQGRGAAANSAVCYCLGITSVDPARIDLLVERFISKERNEPPDIDIDFEHERREEVLQYIYNKYGRDRAALVAEVISYRRRSAIRDIGKALGLSLDCVDRLAKAGDWWDRDVIKEDRIRELGLDPQDLTLRRAVKLAGQLIGFPRHLSQHVGGFVISRGPLCEIVPIENAAMPDRTVIEWDKDDIDDMGMLKIDCLGLGMLTCIRKALALVNGWSGDAAERHSDEAPLQFHTIPPEDPAVYDMLCRGDSVGVFQVESRAQMSMLPRLKPRSYYDLVIEVAIVRPGPIQGGMVHPYLRRRSGTEPVIYADERVQKVLERTLGVPLFQEQAMRLVMVAAGFTAGEADQLRRAMAAWKRKEHLIERLSGKIVTGMLANGYTHAYALQVVQQIRGFSGYGFPESHAASFALLVYVSAWLKRHHPAAFAAALINSQPMGFYQPAQIVRDAQAHGVTVLPVDVNASGWDCRLESDGATTRRSDKGFPALRLGMRLVASMRETEARAIEEAVARHGPFASIEGLWRASRARVATLRALAAADAFRSMGIDRQHALWEILRLRDEEMPLFDGQRENQERRNEGNEGGMGPSSLLLPVIPAFAQMVHDYAATGLSLKAHPVAFARAALNALHVAAAEQLADEQRWPHGRRVTVAGLVLVRQRPSTASGILFMTLEDETGVANLVVKPAVYERHRRALRQSVALIAWGRVERAGQVVHVLVERAANLNELNPGEAVPAPPMESLSRDFH